MNSMTTDKYIKNEQWYVGELISKINNGVITKPKFQRKKKWDKTPKKDNIPDEQSYINFLYKAENSVHAITFGQETESQSMYYSNIDGNNRINAIKHYMDKPFELFPQYLIDLNNFIDTIDVNVENKHELKQIFSQLSYNETINFKYHKYFIESGYIELYNNILKIFRDEFEQEIEKIQEKLKVNGKAFDMSVKISVNLFEGYNTDELCETFEQINKYNTKLTETELLACLLYNEVNFTINDAIFKTEIQQQIKKYYSEKAIGEVLTCYDYDINEGTINAHDFIVSFQNLCSEKYNFIDKSDVDGLSLFYKIYKALYGGFINTFTNDNVNEFIYKINSSCELFKQVVSNIFTDKINSKLFNKSCQAKITTLKKNNMYILLCCIIGYITNKVDATLIESDIEKCLLYHFMVCDLKNKDLREELKMYDNIVYEAGGAYIDNMSKKMLSSPETISNKLTRELFDQLITKLYIESNKPYTRTLENGKIRNDERRSLNFFVKTLMFYYYKQKMPVNMLNNKFSIEHIFPNSSVWDGELDKDRPGNLVPIIDTINSSRGNRHIDEYKKCSDGIEFCEFIKDIVHTTTVYNSIVSHENRKCTITYIQKYNELCDKNEKIYKQNFIDCLFKPHDNRRN